MIYTLPYAPYVFDDAANTHIPKPGATLKCGCVQRKPNAIILTLTLECSPAAPSTDGLERLTLNAKGESVEAIDTHKFNIRGVASQIESDDDDKISE